MLYHYEYSCYEMSNNEKNVRLLGMNKTKSSDNSTTAAGNPNEYIPTQTVLAEEPPIEKLQPLV